MDSDEDVDMSWVELAQDTHTTAMDKAPRRELSPLAVVEKRNEVKRAKLEDDQTTQASTVSSSEDEEDSDAQEKEQEIIEHPKLKTVDINDREYVPHTTFYLMSRPIEEPPFIDYEPFQ